MEAVPANACRAALPSTLRPAWVEKIAKSPPRESPFVAGSESFAIVLTDEDGISRLAIGKMRGRRLHSLPFAKGKTYGIWYPDEHSPPILRSPDHWPVLLAIDGDKVVWADDELLVCIAAQSPYVEKWRLPLPMWGLHKTRPRMIDRAVSTHHVVIQPDLIAIRQGTKLYCYGL